MSSINVFQVAMDLMGPPGLTHPLFMEKYSWVDQRLREMYYGYALTSDNYVDFQDEGLLNENFAWVDKKLEIMWGSPYDVISSSESEETSYGSQDESDTLIGHKRRRSESDISDYVDEVERVFKRLGCQSPVSSGKNSDVVNIIPYYDDLEDDTAVSSLSYSDSQDDLEIENFTWSNDTILTGSTNDFGYSVVSDESDTENEDNYDYGYDSF